MHPRKAERKPLKKRKSHTFNALGFFVLPKTTLK